MARISTAERATIESRRVQRVYAVLARVYDAAFDWALGPGRRRAISRLPVDEGDRVLEVGVGTGLSLPYYPERIRVTGIDISEPMLEQARERAEALGRGRVVLEQMDARALKFADESFDCIFAPYVISVVPEPERVMAEIRRVCRPGGRVVVVNHFHGSNWLLRLGERVFTPLSQWIGFRMDLPVEVVTRAPGFRVEHQERVNLFGLWRLIILRRD